MLGSNVRVALGVKLDGRVEPKTTVRVVPRGTPAVARDGETVLFEDQVAEEHLDFVVYAVGIYAEPGGSVVTADGKPRAAAMTMHEVARVDMTEFKRRGKALLAGAQNVPGFNEVPGTWATLPAKT